MKTGLKIERKEETTPNPTKTTAESANEKVTFFLTFIFYFYFFFISRGYKFLALLNSNLEKKLLFFKLSLNGDLIRKIFGAKVKNYIISYFCKLHVTFSNKQYFCFFVFICSALNNYTTLLSFI